MILTKRILVLILSYSIFLTQAQAGLIINNTRIIYNEEERESIVQLKNINTINNPILVQIWMDNGDPNADVNELSVPFNIMPPISRIEAEKGQAIRILRTKDIPVIDRESLFWINFLDVPQKPTARLANGENLLQFSVRSRLKFFYRPKNLSMSIDDAHKLVKLTALEAGSGYKVLVKNPTPYHVTIGSLDIKSDDNTMTYAYLPKEADSMLAPFSEKEITLKSNAKKSRLLNSVIHYTLMNDFGSEINFHQP